MKRYVMLQAPKADEYDHSPQIRIIDNSTAIGKKRVEALCMEGWIGAGFIESEKSPASIKNGINRERDDVIEEYHKLFNEISKMADSHLNRI